VRSGGRRWLSPEQQWVRLRASLISNGRGLVRRNELVWEFEARPSPLGRLYRVRIRYKKGETPQILVLSPDLNVLAEGRHLPHVYSTNPVRLCLYDPAAGDWSAEASLSDTIVPWIYLWLFYFEEWLVSGEWKGGGRHPEKRDAA
jgi:hypothetical protein